MLRLVQYAWLGVCALLLTWGLILIRQDRRNFKK